MKSWIATTLTAVLLVAGTGGAIAVAGTGSSGGPQGGAACGQYNPGHQKNGKPCKRHNCGKHHNQACPPPKKHHKPKHHGNPFAKCTIHNGSNGIVVLYCPRGTYKK